MEDGTPVDHVDNDEYPPIIFPCAQDLALPGRSVRPFLQLELSLRDADGDRFSFLVVRLVVPQAPPRFGDVAKVANDVYYIFGMPLENVAYLHQMS